MPPVRIGVWVKVRVSFRFAGKPDNCPEENSPLVRVWVRVGFGGWGQFSSRAIVLEPFKTTGWLQGRLSLSSFRGR